MLERFLRAHDLDIQGHGSVFKLTNLFNFDGLVFWLDFLKLHKNCAVYKSILIASIFFQKL